MTFLKSTLAKGALAAILASSALATTASADIVCNRWGDCWQVRDRFDYPLGLGIVVHPDAWDGYHYDHFYRWHGDHYDRGYYRGGIWFSF